jgi:hypothetical protein
MAALATRPSRLEIAFVVGKGLAHSERPSGLDYFADRVIATRQLARNLSRFPVRQDGRAVAVLMVVSLREALQPGAACPVRLEHGPNAARLVAPVGEPDALRDAGRVWFLAHRQLETRRAVFQGCGSNAAGHGRRCPVVEDPCRERATRCWSVNLVPIGTRLCGVPSVSPTWGRSREEWLAVIWEKFSVVQGLSASAAQS